MKHPIFSHVLTILVVVWLAALGVAGILYPERTSALFEKAMAVAAESEGGPEAGSESLLARINVERLFENSLGNWLVFVSAVFVGFLAGKICAAVLARVGRRLDARGWTARAHLANDLVGPASLALFTLGLAVGLAALEMSDPLRAFSFRTLQLLYSIAVFWYGYNLVSVVDAGLRRMTARTASKLDAQLVPLIRKTLRAVLVVIGVLFVVESVFEQDIGAWLAGLGIAGLAVSLAAQDSLKNLFGSITILLDRPFNVGERIIYGGYDGAVEEIGFRSTKVRTAEGSLVTIPNSTIVNSPDRKPRPPAGHPADHGPDDHVRHAPREDPTGGRILRAILDEEGIREPIHPTINGDEFPPRVFFKDYQADSLELFVDLLVRAAGLLGLHGARPAAEPADLRGVREGRDRVRLPDPDALPGRRSETQAGDGDARQGF